MPTDFEQSTGLERLELIGKMQGYDIFDLKPLDASRKGMLAIVVYPIDDSMFKWRGPCSKCRVSMCTNFFFFFLTKELWRILLSCTVLAMSSTLDALDTPPIPTLRTG